MSVDAVADSTWSRLSEFIAGKLGLHFPPARRNDLRRGMDSVADEFGFADVDACIDWLLTTQLSELQLRALASHLTVGETYFMRENKAFAALAERVLPELIERRRASGKRLRLWSAGCCTGEEAYSLAITVRQALPDCADWHVTILATDVNEKFLRKAALGVYAEWSFRESPPGFRDRYFQLLEKGRYEIRTEIKKMVTFAPQNLAQDSYPTLITDTNAIDVIFCRNVLMYFTPQQAVRSMQNLHRALAEDGWLTVGSCEASQTLLSQFVPANFPGVVLYRKTKASVQSAAAWTPPASEEPDRVLATVPQTPSFSPTPEIVEETRPDEILIPISTSATALETAESLYQQGCYADAADVLRSAGGDAGLDATGCSLPARSLANQGDLVGALACCDRWIAADKLDASGHYLRATVLLELGEPAQSRQSLQRAVYLRPDFALAHFALGNLARSDDKNDEARRHFANAARLLQRCACDETLPESDGLTAGRLNEIIASLTVLEPAP